MEDNDKNVPGETGDVDEGAAGAGAQAGEAAAPPEEDELSRLKSRFMYLAAEFENYRKRAARERADLVAYGNERLLAAILPTLDNMERALAQDGASDAARALHEGIRLTYDHLLAELRKFGLEQISAEGRPFDPRYHEAVARVPWEGKPEGTVLSESRKGYLLNGRLLRPAQVVVAQGAPETGPDGPERDDAPAPEN